MYEYQSRKPHTSFSGLYIIESRFHPLANVLVCMCECTQLIFQAQHAWSNYFYAAPVVTTLPIITTTRALLTCTASLSNLNWRYPCGLNTVCITDLSTSTGVRCECASGYVSNSSAGCIKLNILINATRVVGGSLSFPVAWQTGLNDSTSAVYQTAVAQTTPMIESLTSTMNGYVKSSVSIKRYRFACKV